MIPRNALAALVALGMLSMAAKAVRHVDGARAMVGPEPARSFLRSRMATWPMRSLRGKLQGKLRSNEHLLRRMLPRQHFRSGPLRLCFEAPLLEQRPLMMSR